MLFTDKNHKVRYKTIAEIKATSKWHKLKLITKSSSWHKQSQTIMKKHHIRRNKMNRKKCEKCLHPLYTERLWSLIIRAYIVNVQFQSRSEPHSGDIRRSVPGQWQVHAPTSLRSNWDLNGNLAGGKHVFVQTDSLTALLMGRWWDRLLLTEGRRMD